MEEVEAYFKNNPPALTPGENVLWWWLRSPGKSGSRAACVHNSEGILDTGGLNVDESNGVRPVLWLKINLDEIDWQDNGNAVNAT